MSRPLDFDERRVLEFLLSEPFPGREELRAQLEHVWVTGLADTCGCPSVTLQVDRRAPAAAVGDRVPADAFGKDSAGTEVGVLLFVDDGYMTMLEVYSSSDADRYGWPTAESIWVPCWSERVNGLRVPLNTPDNW